MSDEVTTLNNPAPTEPAQPETAPVVAEAMTSTQTVPVEDDSTPQEPSPAPEPSTPATTDTTPVEITPEAPEAPRAEPVIESPNIPVNTEVPVEAEPEKTPENIAISEPQPQTAQTEPASAPEAPVQTTTPSVETPVETAQTPPNEPLNPEPEKAEAPTKGLALKLLIKAREAIQFRKRKKLDKLMSLFLKKSQITNDDVEKLLHVSDATATRYLSILEKEGKIKQSGKTGKGVSYSRI